MIMLCGHCGNRTTLEKHGEYKTKEYKFDVVTKKGAVNEISWGLLRCVTCSKPTLVEYRVEEPEIFPEEKILYPAAETPLPNLPQKVEKAYAAALSVRSIEPNACAVLVGRTLEAACNHEKAQGSTLAQKLNYLAQNGRIPNTLAEMALHLKELRNLGAHDAEDEVTQEDVPIIVDFLKAILEYLYIAPAKIEAVRARLNKGGYPRK
jgi:Domain of unknown function (DUF4145)